MIFHFLSSSNIVCYIPFQLTYLNNYGVKLWSSWVMHSVRHMWRNLLVFASGIFKALRKLTAHSKAFGCLCRVRFIDFKDIFPCLLMLDYSRGKSFTNKQFHVQIQLNACPRALVYCSNICSLWGRSRNARSTFVPNDIRTANPSFRIMSDSWYLMAVRLLQCCGETGCDFVELISGSLV